MKGKFILVLLAAASNFGFSSSSSHAQADEARAECDRLIRTLEEKTPAEAYGTLKKMQVFRQGNQYQACIDTMQSAQAASTNQDSVKVGEFVGMDVFNEKGEQVGNVDRLAHGSDRRVYVLMTYRGPRWPGNKQVAIPVKDLEMQDGSLLLPGVGEKELLAMPAVPEDGGAYKFLRNSETVSIQRSTVSAREAGSIQPQQ